MGAPAESRTVPETIIAGRCWVGAACANAGIHLVENKTARVAKHTLSRRIIDNEFIAGIFTHEQAPCKEKQLQRMSFAYRRPTKSEHPPI